MPAQVMLVDDHPLFREGLRSRLERQQDFTVVAEAGCGEEAVEAVSSRQLDLVLLDLRMPGMDGFEALRRIKRAAPRVKVVVLTMDESEEVLLEAIGSGASGYLPKTTPPADVVQALRTVLAGVATFPPELLRRALTEASAEPALDPRLTRRLSELTQREREVLRLLGRGCSNRDVAEQLVVVEATVKKHVHNVLQKLDVSDRTQAALLAVKAGLVS